MFEMCVRGAHGSPTFEDYLQNLCWLRIAFECVEYVELTLCYIVNVLQTILDQVEVNMNSNVDFMLYFQ